jgi:glutathione S-transferase
LALEELGLPYETVLHDFDAGSLSSPAYRAINPNGLIPALETPDGPMFETGAIMLWLVDTHGGLGPRAGEAGRAAFLAWLVYVANTVHPAVMDLVHPERVAGDDAMTDVGARAAAKLRAAFAKIEAIAETESWISKSAPSALTLYLGVMMRWARTIAAVPEQAIHAAEFPKLQAILAAVESRPAALRVAKDEGLGAKPFSDPQV